MFVPHLCYFSVKVCATVVFAHQAITFTINRAIIRRHRRCFKAKDTLEQGRRRKNIKRTVSTHKRPPQEEKRSVECVKVSCASLSIPTSGTRAVPKRAVREGYTQSYMSAPSAEQTAL